MHYIDTLNKCNIAKQMYLAGVSLKDIAKHFSVNYITIWRWLTIVGLTPEEKKTHTEKEVK
jgi:uncharacterized protein YjcR